MWQKNGRYKRRSSKVRKRSKNVGTRKIPQVDSCVWKEAE